MNYNYEVHLKLITQYENNIDNYAYMNNKDKEYERDKIQDYKTFFINNVVSDIPEDLKEIKKYNLLERILNGLHYKFMFIYFLKKCNYEIITNSNEYELNETDDEVYREIDKIIISKAEAVEIENKMKLKQATETEKFNIDKYYFYTFLNSPNLTQTQTQEPTQEEPQIMIEDTFNNLYIDCWADKLNRSKLKNIKNEILNR
jgi:hypothetical protein